MRNRLLGAEPVRAVHHAAGEVSRFGFIVPKAARRFARAIIQGFDVRTPGDDAQARKLSGGNLQKFVIGREIIRRPKLLVVDHEIADNQNRPIRKLPDQLCAPLLAQPLFHRSVMLPISVVARNYTIFIIL